MLKTCYYNYIYYRIINFSHNYKITNVITQYYNTLIVCVLKQNFRAIPKEFLYKKVGGFVQYIVHFLVYISA